MRKPDSKVLDHSKLQSLRFPLNNYQFDHGLKEDSLDHSFIGRVKVKRRLIELIKPVCSNKSTNPFAKKNMYKGAYLVTGYRGMGKTSLVNTAILEVGQAIDDHNGSGKNAVKTPTVFRFSLSDSDLLEFELLRQIAWELNLFIEDIDNGISPKAIGLLSILKFVLPVIVFFLAVCSFWFVFGREGFFGHNFYRGLGSNLGDKIGEDGTAVVFLGIFAFLLISAFRLFRYLIYRHSYRKKHPRPKSPTYASSDSGEGIEKIRKGIIKLNKDLQERVFSSAQYSSDGAVESDSSAGSVLENLASGILKIFTGNEARTSASQTFQKATVKEIEQQLYKILKYIDDLRVHISIPDFLIVVDELDKVEPDYYFSPGERGGDSKEGNPMLPFDVTTKARRRNEAISKLLANLKNFLNNANCKFVFIGGRGMYDAALADIADRESFYSSIFTEVLYVENFFKDKLKDGAGLTEMTEVYLCQLLAYPILNDLRHPTPTIKHKCDKPDEGINNLKTLIELYECIGGPMDLKLKFKVMHTLQNFVVFLSYRSNGSPKKLIELIESYIRWRSDRSNVGDLEPKNIKDLNLIGWYGDHRECSCYLKLNPVNQYEINLHSNIYRPFMSLNSRHFKHLGDKLLYTTAFLVDHILKFHKAAFSWRNLEHLPDIILSNNDPNLRGFFNDIMEDLTRKYLRKTVNAVFDYKFNSRIQNEMKFISKISEQSAAAFNFTLDESFHLKSYYKRKLAAKYREYRALEKSYSEFEFIYTIGHLHSEIGDLHYYDEEYDDAILNYSDCIQILHIEAKHLKSSVLRSHYFMLYVRNMLSLGLCFEKSKMYDRAFTTYRSLLKASRTEVEKGRGRKKQSADLFSTRHHLDLSDTGMLDMMQLYQRPHVAVLGVIEKDRQDGLTWDNLRRNAIRYFQILGLRKSEDVFPSGQGFFSYEVIEADFEKSDRHIPVDKKRLLTLISDYFFNVGGILFYKNALFFRMLYPKNQESSNKDAVSKYVDANILKMGEGSIYQPSHAAFMYYTHALICFNTPYVENIHHFFEEKRKKGQIPGIHTLFGDKEDLVFSHLAFVTNYLDFSLYKMLNSDQFDFLGNILSKMADSVLCCLSDNGIKDVESDVIEMLRYFEEPNIIPDHRDKVIHLFLREKVDLATVFLLYRISYHLYNRAGRKYSAVFQYKKVLYLIREHTGALSKIDGWSIDTITRMVAICIKQQTDTSNVSNRTQIAKYRNITDNDEAFTPFIYNNLSNSPEIREIMLLKNTIFARCGYSSDEIYIGEYSTLSSIHVRVMELKYNGDKYLRFFKKGKDDRYEDLLGEMNYWADEKLELALHLICDAMFCFSEMISSIQSYGIGYIFNHRSVAVVNQKMGTACVYYKMVSHVYALRFPKKNKKPKTLLSDLVGSRSALITDPFMYYDTARVHCKLSIELHTEGSTYKSISKDFYSLDDDYNDNLTHFCAAIERHAINRGRLDKRTQELRDILKDSELLNILNYVQQS